MRFPVAANSAGRLLSRQQDDISSVERLGNLMRFLEMVYDGCSPVGASLTLAALEAHVARQIAKHRTQN